MKLLGHSILLPDLKTVLDFPLILSPSPKAGFPSPAEDYIEGRIDFNKELVKHPAATFVVRVQGDSMIGAGIHSGDRLIVDKSLKAKDGQIVVGIINAELIVKRLKITGKSLTLISENPKYPPQPISEGAEFQVWGVVAYVIHKP